MAVETATRTMKNYVGGAWTDAQADEQLPVTNPATGETLADVPLSSTADVDRAVRAAREAFPGWRATPPLERARACFELKYLLEERKDDLAHLVTKGFRLTHRCMAGDRSRSGTSRKSPSRAQTFRSMNTAEWSDACWLPFSISG
jgi:Aldehyde dehydrogenase family